MRLLPTLPLAIVFFTSSCTCNERLARPYEEPPPAAIDAGVPTPSCATGSVQGRVCAPDRQTWISGATVEVTGTDCNQQPFSVVADSAADGSFTVAAVPVGRWTAHAVLGAFSQDYAVTVEEGKTVLIPDDQLCVAQKQTKIAVVTGAGDRIEDLLTGLSLKFDTFAGDATNWPTTAAPFLSDLQRLKAYDLVFIDCAAAKESGSSTINLGPDATAIQTALHDYVAQGGSLYSSDWALLFPALAFPGKMRFHLNGGAMANPFDARHLMGYAPQTVTADVTKPELAVFLGKAKVEIAFPHQSGANSMHWGLFDVQDPTADVLIRAPKVSLCETRDVNCSSANGDASQVPLAVHFKLTGAGTRGGNVVYTSFHNIAQPTDDVSKVLKFIVLHL